MLFGDIKLQGHRFRYQSKARMPLFTSYPAPFSSYCGLLVE